MAPHSSTLAWKIPWMEEPGRLQSMESRRVGTTERLYLPFSLSCIGEGNGNPLQCSCLENPRDRGAWWAAIYGVAQSPTQLKRLSRSSSIPISGLSTLLHYSFCHSYLTRASLVAQSVNNLPAMGGPGSIPRSGRSPGEGNGNPLQ